MSVRHGYVQVLRTSVFWLELLARTEPSLALNLNLGAIDVVYTL